MKNKKNILLSVGILLAVIGLGIGYAFSTQNLTINGTATVKEGTSFNVQFKSAVADENQVEGVKESTASVTTDKKVANMTVTLTNVTDSQVATFTVENTSAKGVAAKITAANVKVYKQNTTEDFTSNFFKVTPVVSDTTISAGSSATFTVKVELVKAVVGSDITENFDIVLSDISAEQE